MEQGKKAIQIAQKYGCTYCDVRIESTERQGLSIENGIHENFLTKRDSGIGVRVLYDGAWGFFATSNYNKLEEGIFQAIKAAKHRARYLKNKVRIADIPVVKRTIKYKVKKKPDLEALVRIGFDCDNTIRENKQIRKSIVSAERIDTKKYFESSDGTRILHKFTDIILDLVATAHGYGITQSINRTEGGRGGLEKIIDDVNAIESAREISEKASQLLNARPVNEEKTTIVMDPDFVALLTHEILGHPSEADRVLGREMAWAGGAWWSGRLGSKIGSSELNVVDDPTIEGSLGWYEFDDEGTPSSKKQILKDGMLVDHMHSRETASIFNTKPNASMRATSYRFMPLIRMACTCIEKGDWDPNEMIKDVKHGYLISGMKVPSIDMMRHNWSISCQYANKIENGEIKEMHRDVIIVGTAPELFQSIDARGKDFTVRPITNCGKGEPMQQMRMGNGGPTIRSIATVKSVLI
jgi:TldD protein